MGYFNDALSISIASRAFLRQVAPTVTQIFIPAHGARLLRLDKAVGRFSAVTQVYVYSLIHEQVNNTSMHLVAERARREGTSMAEAMIATREETPDVRHLCSDTLQWVLDFLAHVPKVESVWVGGLCTCDDEPHWCVTRDGPHTEIRRDLEYDPKLEYTNKPNHLEEFRKFLAKVCKAYDNGATYCFHGIVFDHRCKYDGNLCLWKGDYAGKTTFEQRREEAERTAHAPPCSMCQLLCSSFPPVEMMAWDATERLPCLTQEQQLETAMTRAPEQAQAAVQDQLLRVLRYCHGRPVYLPPDFKEMSFVMGFDEDRLQKMKLLLANGADASDLRCRKMLVDGKLDKTDAEHMPLGFDPRLGTKRLTDMDTFKALLSMGFPLEADDFAPEMLQLDLQDPRSRPRRRK